MIESVKKERVKDPTILDGFVDNIKVVKEVD